ncbi:hypothetical protein INT47_002491 [Mucor saturninus]|uniref:Uncharacterized protein n=1 Tax=Mucor saturninus TaxID=64648 RepID=A0A8H7VDJ5_9FUNG|nr:hypothetical protein INT47_002491 [Mucor saturninus]
MDYSDYESYRVVKKSRQNPVDDLSQQNEALPQQDILNDWNNDFDLNDNICYYEPMLTEEEVIAKENEAIVKEKAAKKAAREKRQMKPTQLANDWKENFESVKAVFSESIRKGFPKAEAVEVETPTVLCEDHEVKFREVKLYGLHRHLKVKFQECICKPL